MRWALPAAVAIALAISGCGSSRLSDTQLRTRATAVCSLAARRTSAIASPSSPGAGAEFFQRGLAVLRPELRRLRGLRPPKDLGRMYSDALSAFSRKLAALSAAVREIYSGTDPVSATTSLQQRLAPIEADEDSLWHALQIPACMNR